MRNFASNLMLGLGIVYVLVGAIGFAVTGFTGFAQTEGPSLLFFELNPLHNVVHLLVGVGLIAAATAGRMGLRMVAGGIAVVYAVVGVAGFFVIGNEANILALNVADNFLHLGSAAVLFFLISSVRAGVPADQT